MREKLITLVIALLLCSAVADNLVVYPLNSQDTLLGVAVADRVATAFQAEFEVLGPVVAPSLVPPLVVEGGFINPTVFLDNSNIASPIGATLARDAIGADYVITGRVDFDAEQLILTMFLASGNGVSTHTVRAPESQPGLLVAKAIALTAHRLGVERPEAETAVNLSGPYGDLVRAIGLIGGGFLVEAEELLIQLPEPDEAAKQLLADLQAVLAGDQGSNPARLATMSLSLEEFNESLSISYFDAFAGRSSLPSPHVWIGVLGSSVNDKDAVTRAFDLAAEAYNYGLIGRASYRLAEGLDGGQKDLIAGVASESVGDLLAAAVVANAVADISLEKEALQRLSRSAPSFTYPFERLSFIGFDEDDAQVAAEALVVAVDLEPQSDLYWTNLGWAYYLLGFLGRSEEASMKAVALDPSQFIAQYNLGLARVVTGRLEEAMRAYNDALRLDPDVDDEAIRDLENALDLYPDQAGVHYSLAVLYEAEGRRGEAADQYERYLVSSAELLFEELANRRIAVLRAPPPPLEISQAPNLLLGADGLEAEPYHPGDLLFPSFEVFTPGEELPKEFEVTLTLRDAQDTVIESVFEAVDVPRGAIGLVLDEIGLELPQELAQGSYELFITVSATEDRSATTIIPFEVEGEPQLVRLLISRNIEMQALGTGIPLYGAGNLDRPTILLDLLLGELREAAQQAEEALPNIEAGRFEGLSGGRLFNESTAEDVRDFLVFLLDQNTRDVTFTFVEAYAQWALDGAPQ
jgi:tetratricopeptide (TPR) repeat protein